MQNFFVISSKFCNMRNVYCLRNRQIGLWMEPTGFIWFTGFFSFILYWSHIECSKQNLFSFFTQNNFWKEKKLIFPLFSFILTQMKDNFDISILKMQWSEWIVSTLWQIDGITRFILRKCIRFHKEMKRKTFWMLQRFNECKLLEKPRCNESLWNRHRHLFIGASWFLLFSFYTLVFLLPFKIIKAWLPYK